MEVKIVDTTLRDGEQKAGIALGFWDKVEIAKLLSSLGVYQIEAGIPAMGGDEKKSIEKIASLGLASKISAWNRMSKDDISHSLDCNVDIIHISVPASDIQIYSKLRRNRVWVKDNMVRAVYFAKEKGAEVVVGLEDASRASFSFLEELCEDSVKLGVNRVRYADTVGIEIPTKIQSKIARLRKNTGVDVEIHCHNDFGMAVANSFTACEAGAAFVDCTIGGIGERAGNCDYSGFCRASGELFGMFPLGSIDKVQEVEAQIKNIIFNNSKRI